LRYAPQHMAQFAFLLTRVCKERLTRGDDNQKQSARWLPTRGEPCR
jgi:hypothetical protein